MQSYDLTLAAETDLRDIWRYTYKTWGPEQADKYFDQIEACWSCRGLVPLL
jgi:toxin ParE1/3/4